MKDIVIVKVQLSLASSTELQYMLIYNKGKTVMYQGAATDEVIKQMAGEVKAFFNARLEPDPEKPGSKIISILDKTTWQSW